MIKKFLTLNIILICLAFMMINCAEKKPEDTDSSLDYVIHEDKDIIIVSDDDKNSESNEILNDNISADDITSEINVGENIPDNFTALFNGTILDNNTMLMWQKEDDGIIYNWNKAIGEYDADLNINSDNVCRVLSLAGYTDWRLPSKDELTGLVNMDFLPTINPVFLSRSSYYWTSTQNQQVKSWCVNFADGGTEKDDISNGYFVRCVRNSSDIVPPINTINDDFINNGDLYVRSKEVAISLSATDNIGVSGYYISELEKLPSIESPVCIIIDPVDNYSEKILFNLSNETEAGTYEKYIHVWFRDEAGNISDSISDSISLIVPEPPDPPYDISVIINNNNSETDSRIITLDLNAINNRGISKYYISELPDLLNPNESTGWMNILSVTNFSSNVPYVLSRGVGTKIIYVWFMSSDGDLSEITSDSITLTVDDSGKYMIDDIPDIGQSALYIDNGDGTISDSITELMWEQIKSSDYKTWAGAFARCDNLILAGYSDWRLPSKRSLVSIINFDAFSPAINTDYFFNFGIGSSLWTSTVTEYNNRHMVISVMFGNGYNNAATKLHKNHHLCVRDGQFTNQLQKSFTDNNDGIIQDNETELMWQKEQTDTFDWNSAITYCENLSLSSFDDWRLPNIKDLESITEDVDFEIPVNSDYFPYSGQNKYWSSSTYQSDTTQAWFVDFKGFGSILSYLKTTYYNVKCVRN